MKNRFINYIITVIIIILTISVILSHNDLEDLPELIKLTNEYYVLLGLCCMGLFWLCDALIIKFTFAYVDAKDSLRHSLKLTMIGQYYNLITPFSSGGQPAQIYTMNNDYDIPVGQASSITINKFMVYHIIITLYALLFFIFKSHFVLAQLHISKIFIYLGLSVNILGIAGIFIICYNSLIVEKIAITIFKILKKMRLGRRIRYENIIRHIEEYKISLFKIFSDKKLLLIISVVTTIQVTLYFSVTYFVYLALGLKSSSYLEILAVQTLLYMVVNFIPTPGNAGVSEGGFYILFNMIFPSDILLYAILLWRFIIFYFNLLASGSVVLIDFLSKKVKQAKILS